MSMDRRSFTEAHACKRMQWAKGGCRDEQVLGKGAFGVVYEAKSLDDHKDYACKSISKAKLVTKVPITSLHACLAIVPLCLIVCPDCFSLLCLQPTR